MRQLGEIKLRLQHSQSVPVVISSFVRVRTRGGPQGEFVYVTVPEASSFSVLLSCEDKLMTENIDLL